MRSGAEVGTKRGAGAGVGPVFGAGASSLLDLLDTPIAPLVTDDVRTGTIAERAARFHAANPGVYAFSVRICRTLRAHGVKRYGMKAVWEILRFRYLETHGEIYRLNNSYTAWYARLIMANEPDLAGFFSTRDGAHDPDYRDREVRS